MKSRGSYRTRDGRDITRGTCVEDDDPCIDERPDFWFRYEDGQSTTQEQSK